MPIAEYPSGAPFPGTIGRTAEESTPAWPATMRAPAGSASGSWIQQHPQQHAAYLLHVTTDIEAHECS